MAEHLIGLTLGAENDWPAAFEALLRRAKLDFNEGGQRHTFRTERVQYEPYDLRASVPHRIIIDRAAWWYPMAREWLKKAAIVDGVYLLNNPFTFQSMEKHTGYGAMMRLGLDVPTTWMLPHKHGPENDRWPATSERYNKLFNLDEVAARVGYPLYMKPFDGGGWRGVSRINNRSELHRAYDASGRGLMHLQAGLADYDHFIRSLTIGPQTRVMRYRPERPMHDRYETTLGAVDSATTEYCATVNRIVNAFFHWEFNSCEVIVKDGRTCPIDYANACPDIALVSLHTHFPWAILSLLKWTIFCAAGGRKMSLDLNTRDYFEIADRPGMSHADKMAAYARLANEYFQAERFAEFCERHFKALDDAAQAYFQSAEFGDLIVASVREVFPPHEQDHYVGQFRRLLAQSELVGAGAS